MKWSQKQMSASMLVLCTVGFIYGMFVLVRYLQNPQAFAEFTVLVFLSIMCIPLSLYYGKKNYEVLVIDSEDQTPVLD